MRYLLITVLLTVSLFGKSVGDYYNDIGKLSMTQAKVMLKAYIDGKDSDYGYTLAAIAWTESCFGKYKMNTHDGSNLKYNGSYGIYHTLLNTAMGREKVKSQWHASRIAEKLYTDDGYAASKAIEELLFWERVWKLRGVAHQYRYIVASYNAGYKSLDSKHGKKYYELIALRVKALKLYFKKHNIDELLK